MKALFAFGVIAVLLVSGCTSAVLSGCSPNWVKAISTEYKTEQAITDLDCKTVCQDSYQVTSFAVVKTDKCVTIANEELCVWECRCDLNNCNPVS